MTFPGAFTHPASGPSQRDARRLAVRWTAGATTEAKRALVEEAGLALATLDDRRPTVAVNQTEGLWWLQRSDGGAVTDDQLGLIENSDLVEWVSPAYRATGPAGTAPAGAARAIAATGTVADAEAVFAVNPTRVWVRQDAVAGSPALNELDVDRTRRGKIPGYTAMPVRTGTAIDVAARVAATAPALAPDASGPQPPPVRLETVPFVSPTCVAPAATAGLLPDDPMFGSQWNLRRMSLPAAWEIVRGDPSVVIAVIDEGVELDHPDLALHPQSWNASTDTPDGSPTGNHGTACAGIAAAGLDNGLGVAGVAGGCQVMAIATATWADVDIAEGIYFAVDFGARVISMSFGVYPEWGVWDFDLIRDALQHAYDRGVLLVAAAGNEDGPVSRFPGSDSRTLCVGGSNRSDERKRTNDSSAEPWWGASYGPDVDVVAPCLQIPTTDRLGTAGYSSDDYTDAFNGTSSATPMVAGVGALLFSLRPELDHVRVRHIIESTCDKISPNLYPYRNVATKPSGTWNEQTGYGRVNAERAVGKAAAASDGVTVVSS